MATPDPTPTPRATESRRRPWALAWMLAFLLALELAARTLWTPAHVDAKLHASIEPSYGYGFEFVRPPCEPSGPDTITCRPTEYRKIPEQSFDAVKRSNAVRMFTVGGSHAAGTSSYTRELGEQLARRCPAVHWEAINLAVVGQGSRRVRLAAEEALRHQPDVLILDFGGSNEYEDERDLGYREQLHSGIWRYLLRSHAIVLGRKLLSKSFPFTKPKPISTGEDETAASRKTENLERWRAGLESNYRALIADARSKGLEVVVVSRASMKPHATGSRQEADQALFESLAGEGVHLLDAHALFHELDARQRKRLFRRDRNHYSRAGQQRIADALALLVLEELHAATPCRTDDDDE